MTENVTVAISSGPIKTVVTAEVLVQPTLRMHRSSLGRSMSHKQINWVVEAPELEVVEARHAIEHVSSTADKVIQSSLKTIRPVKTIRIKQTI